MYMSIGGVDCTKYVQRQEYSVYETDETVDEWQSANGRHHEAYFRGRIMGTIPLAFISEEDYADFIELFNSAVEETTRVLTISVHVMNTAEFKEIEAYYTITPEQYINYDLDYMGVINKLSLQIRER